MPIMFNSLLVDAGLPLGEVRLLRHKDKSSERGRTPYDLWRDNRPLFDLYQSTQKIENESRLDAIYWASFVGTPADETLFVGVYRKHEKTVLGQDQKMPHRDDVDKAGTCHSYKLSLESHLGDMIGRLVIDWGPGDRSWIQRADKQNKPVIELRETFKEPEFPGFLNFIEPLSRLDALPSSWVAALRAAEGVYLLTCPKAKEQYVGSATGQDGFWGRWQAYAKNGHGENVKLKSHEPSDYQVSILEVAGSSQNVLQMESQWKAKLQTKEMGLNGN